MPFQKCKYCIVRSCCGEVCQDFKEYTKRKYNITINEISLKQAEIAFGKIKSVEKNLQKLKGE